MFRRRRSKDAFPEDLKALYPRLWRYALVLTGAKDRADDLAQMSCLRALEKRDQVQEGSHLDRWVFRIAQRTWFNELRAQAVRRGGGLVPVESAELVDTSAGPDSNLSFREVLSDVMALPEAQRIAVLLVYVEGYRYAEAAGIMEIPKGTVMSRLSAARRKLVKRRTETRSEPDDGHAEIQ